MKTGWLWLFPGTGALLLVIAIGMQIARIGGSLVEPGGYSVQPFPPRRAD